MLKKSLALNILVLKMALLGSAATFAEGPGWTVASKVTKVAVVVNGGVNVRLSPELKGCTSQSRYGANYASVYPDHAALELIHSTLVEAYKTGREVSVYLSDNACRVGEVVLGGTQ